MYTRQWIVLFLFVAAGVRELAAQGKTGTIAGAIVARDGGRPVADAVVTIEGTNLTIAASIGLLFK
jgi:hypothetical protein